ncbi:MAG TPA: GFA family protein [Candidatus Binatia bacterium]|nr:GFA family protein [Candidatus Binatia bacterium]
MICHCESCRRAVGAPAVPWLTFPRSRFSFAGDAPAEYRSTPPVVRTFCPRCGTSLTYVHADRPAEIDVTTATLDDAAAFPPTYHAWTSDDVGWVRFADGLPAYEGAGVERRPSRAAATWPIVAGTMLHTVVFPGTVLVAIPYLLLSAGPELHRFDSLVLRAIGIVAGVAGVVLGAWCTRQFVVLGRGTPNPLDPPKLLVQAGPYRVVRNPMYVAVGLVLAGEAMLAGSVTLLVYAGLIAAVFHGVVVLYEERALARLFGPAYADYCRRVPRWIPRLGARGDD